MKIFFYFRLKVIDFGTARKCDIKKKMTKRLGTVL